MARRRLPGRSSERSLVRAAQRRNRFWLSTLDQSSAFPGKANSLLWMHNYQTNLQK
jgi:hypothetical protein